MRTGPLGSFLFGWFFVFLISHLQPSFYRAGHWTRRSPPVRAVNLHNLENSPLKQIYTKYELF